MCDAAQGANIEQLPVSKLRELGLEHSDYYSASDDYPEPAQTLLSQLESRLDKARQALHVAETADRWRDARRLERAIKLLKSLTDSAQSQHKMKARI